jgi:hypothetical protein
LAWQTLATLRARLAAGSHPRTGIRQRKTRKRPQVLVWMSTSAGNSLRIALCQVRVDPDKRVALANAQHWVERAVQEGAKLVVLPECFNCPYDTSCFPKYAEPLPRPGTTAAPCDTSVSETAGVLQKLARAHGITILRSPLAPGANYSLAIARYTCSMWMCRVAFGSASPMF